MQDNPTVEDIMAEIRQGLSDTDLSPATQRHLASLGGLQDSLRQAYTTASLLGRCGGSLRGRLCKLLAPLARPVIEQIDLFHAAIVRSLETIASQSSGNADTKERLAALEQRLAHIESQAHPKGKA